MMVQQRQSDEAAEGAIRRIISDAARGKISQAEMTSMLHGAYYPCVGKRFNDCSLLEIKKILIWHMQQILALEDEIEHMEEILGKDFPIESRTYQ